MTSSNINKKSGSRADLFSTETEVAKLRAWLKDRFKSRTLTSSVVRFTPAMAEYIIKNHNGRNRPVRMQRINRYSKIITEGRMKTHSQGISFGTDGNLNNGQHRLIAVMKAGVPCDFYVTFGEDVSVFDAIDTGGTRSAKDALHIDGRKDLVCLAATVRIIINIERGALYSNGPEAQVENDEVVDFVNANEDVNECIKIGNRIRRKLAGSAAPLAAAIFLIRRDSAHPDRLEQFVEKLISGDNLSATSPILKLRDRISHRVDARDNGNTVSRNSHVVAAFIIAWNLWNAKKGGAIAWKHKTEAFPKIA